MMAILVERIHAWAQVFIMPQLIEVCMVYCFWVRSVIQCFLSHNKQDSRVIVISLVLGDLSINLLSVSPEKKAWSLHLSVLDFN